MKKTWKKYICSFSLVLVFIVLFGVKGVYAEGSKDLVENGGYRPYIERNKLDTHDISRKQVFYVRVYQGEIVDLGTSVHGADLTGLEQYIGEENTKAEIRARWYPTSKDAEDSDYYLGAKGENDQYFDTGNNDTQTNPEDTRLGYIANPTRESNGPNYTASLNEGYNPFEYHVLKDGYLKVTFFSSGYTASNPNPVLTTNQWQSHGSTIAAWDITVLNNNEIKDGRVYTKTLFINMGNNVYGHDVLKSIIYVYTDDKYLYKINFNGMDPFGFILYANNRGPLYQNDSLKELGLSPYASLYHSVLGDDNNVTGLNNILANIYPTEENNDRTYRIFFNKPDPQDYPTENTLSKGTITDLKFIGTAHPQGYSDNTSYVEKGGKFTFTAANDTTASSYQLRLKFALDNIVTLSGELNPGTNTVFWDGKDAKGKYVQPGTYQTECLEVKGGEIHFPLLDVENNRNGIIVQRMNGANLDGENDYKVYYNNVNDDQEKYACKYAWTEIAGGGNYSITGISSKTGAMSFSATNAWDSINNWNHTGNQAILDIWTYLNVTTVSKTEYVIVDQGAPGNPHQPDNPGKPQAPTTPTIPEVKTGDNTDYTIYIVTIAVSMIVIVGIVVVKFRKKQK